MYSSIAHDFSKNTEKREKFLSEFLFWNSRLRKNWEDFSSFLFVFKNRFGNQIFPVYYSKKHFSVVGFNILLNFFEWFRQGWWQKYQKFRSSCWFQRKINEFPSLNLTNPISIMQRTFSKLNFSKILLFTLCSPFSVVNWFMSLFDKIKKMKTKSCLWPSLKRGLFKKEGNRWYFIAI